MFRVTIESDGARPGAGRLHQLDVLTRISVQRQSQVELDMAERNRGSCASRECERFWDAIKITTFGTYNICPSDILETPSIQPQRAGELAWESASAQL